VKKRNPGQSGQSGGFFGWLGRRKERDRSRTDSGPSPWIIRLKVAFAILIWACVGAGITIGFTYLNRYIRTQGPGVQKSGPMELVGVPDWLEPKWIETITQTAGGGRFLLNDQSARQVAEKLEALSWMDQVRAKATPTVLQVEAVYRKPVARVKLRTDRWVYLDGEGMVLDSLPLDSMPLAEISGLAADSVPSPGGICRAEEAAAAIQILKILDKMDQRCCPDKPLLREIASIEMGNFTLKKSASQPHITLVAKDDTPIHWGAAYGKAALYLEADEAEKLTMLYNFYTQNGNTLLGKVKYIELRTPVNQRPRPR
jgi:hypothetical protein